MSSIFFVPVAATTDHDAGVECVIYSDDGTRLASHLMTTEGAVIRLHDFESAIGENLVFEPRVFAPGTAPEGLTPATCPNPIHHLSSDAWRLAGEPLCRDCEPEE